MVFFEQKRCKYTKEFIEITDIIYRNNLSYY